MAKQTTAVKLLLKCLAKINSNLLASQKLLQEAQDELTETELHMSQIYIITQDDITPLSGPAPSTDSPGPPAPVPSPSDPTDKPETSPTKRTRQLKSVKESEINTGEQEEANNQGETTKPEDESDRESAERTDLEP